VRLRTSSIGMRRAADLIRLPGPAGLQEAIAHEFAALALPATSRLAYYILEIAPRSACEHRGGVFEFRIHQGEIAAFLGLSRAFVNAQLSKWKNDRVLGRPEGDASVWCMIKPATLIALIDRATV